MTNQPKYYVGIAKCGCVVSFIENNAGHEEMTAYAVSEFIKDGYVIEGRNECGTWGHTCGKAVRNDKST